MIWFFNANVLQKQLFGFEKIYLYYQQMHLKFSNEKKNIFLKHGVELETQPKINAKKLICVEITIKYLPAPKDKLSINIAIINRKWDQKP